MKKTRVEIYNPPQKARRIPAPDDRAASRPRTEDERESDAPSHHVDARGVLEQWLTVDKQVLWGTSSPFDLVEGGKEKMVEKLLAVTSDVKHFPKDDSPYGSLLTGRLVSQSELSAVDTDRDARRVRTDGQGT